nr:hypothetical protein [uncultured Roseovarius sp.]
MIWAAWAAIEAIILVVYGRSAWARRFWNALIALDRFGNTLIGGSPDETISARAARQSHKRGWRLLGRILDAIDPGHMAEALEPSEHDPAWE